MNTVSRTLPLEEKERFTHLQPPCEQRPGIPGLCSPTKRTSCAISRVLSWMTIYLGHQLPDASSDLPEQSASNLILPLFGLAAGGVYQASQSPGFWCALAAPFHPYQVYAWRFVFCGTFLRVAPTGRYPAPCSVQLGLSSDVAFRPDTRGHLANSRLENILSPQRR